MFRQQRSRLGRLRLSLFVCMVLPVQISTASSAFSPRALAKDVLQHISQAAVTTAVPRRPKRPSAGSSVQLDDYITFLPVPAAPPAWTQMCSQVEQQGAAALAPWLHNTPCDLPDIQGSAGTHCQLGRRPWAHKFQQPLLAAYAAALFHSIVAGRVAAAKQLGAPAPQLSRWDLFHGHLFIAASNITTDSKASCQQPHPRGLLSNLRQPGKRLGSLPSRTRRAPAAACPGDSNQQQQHAAQPAVGILFHAAEYPAFSNNTFPIFLGHCQKNSTSVYHPRAMDLRNILWYQGKLAVLDVAIDSPLHALLHEGTEPLRTVYEEDFGQSVADLLLLREPHRRRRSLQASQRLESSAWQARVQSQQALAACSADLSGVFVSY